MEKVIPAPGFILVKPYIEEKVFKSLTQLPGGAQKSVVISVGENYIDDYGNDRKPDSLWKEGSVIIHGDNNNDIELDHEQLRFVHFSRVMGVINES